MKQFNTDQKVQFPVTFQLKIIAENVQNQALFIKRFSDILTELDITYGKFSTRPSRKGTYISYSVTVTILTRTCFDQLYQNMGTIDSVRYVI